MNESGLSRLHWQCRRGMLELDLLLIPFVEQVYMQLPAAEQALFVELLSCHDQDLYAWLILCQQPPAHLVGLIEKLRNHAHAS